MVSLSAGGLYNGLILLIDDETKSYWDHISGECVHGPLKGTKLDTWSMEISDVGRVRAAEPGLHIALSDMGLKGKAAGAVMASTVHGKGLLPPRFRETMGEGDPRLDRMAHGVGVIVDGEARFYPMALASAGLQDEWSGRKMTMAMSEPSAVPVASWEDGTQPMQLFTRWYGFSYTYSGCGLYTP